MHRTFYIFGKGTLLFIAISLTAVSCSSGKPKLDLVPVRGTVLVKGQPASGVLLSFFPAAEGDIKGLLPFANTLEDGTFVVMTGAEEGAQVGDYVVTMVWLKDPGVQNAKNGEPVSMTMARDPVDKLGGKLKDRKNGFKVKVEKGVTELPPFKVP